MSILQVLVKCHLSLEVADSFLVFAFNSIHNGFLTV